MSRETDVIPRGIVKRQKSNFEPTTVLVSRSIGEDRTIRRAYTESKVIMAQFDNVGGQAQKTLTVTILKDPSFLEHREAFCASKSQDGASDISTEVPLTPKDFSIFLNSDAEDACSERSQCTWSSMSERAVGPYFGDGPTGAASQEATPDASFANVLMLTAIIFVILQTLESLLGTPLAASS